MNEFCSGEWIRSAIHRLWMGTTPTPNSFGTSIISETLLKLLSLLFQKASFGREKTTPERCPSNSFEYKLFPTNQSFFFRHYLCSRPGYSDPDDFPIDNRPEKNPKIYISPASDGKESWYRSDRIGVLLLFPPGRAGPSLLITLCMHRAG